jgi:hypothetical protein
MGGHKPSKLLADMMEFYLAGLDQSLPFHYLFTQRLPQALRRQLGEAEPGDLRALAARADKLWAVHAPTASALTAVSSSEALSEEAAKATAAVVASSAAEGAPRVPRSWPRAVPLLLSPLPRRTLLCLLSPGSPVVSAFSTGTSPTELLSAHRPAAGETSQPGAA